MEAKTPLQDKRNDVSAIFQPHTSIYHVYETVYMTVFCEATQEALGLHWHIFNHWLYSCWWPKSHKAQHVWTIAFIIFTLSRPSTHLKTMKSIFAITMMLAAAASADYTSQSDAQIRSLYGDIEEDYMASLEHQYEGELEE